MAAVLVLLIATVGGLGIGYTTGWIRFGTSPSVVKGDPSLESDHGKAADDNGGDKQSIEKGSMSETEDRRRENPTPGKQASSTHRSSAGEVPMLSSSVPRIDPSDSVKTNDAAMTVDSAAASNSPSKAADPPVDAAQAAKIRSELVAGARRWASTKNG